MAARKSGEPWTSVDENTLKRDAARNVPTEQIAKELERTESAVRAKASEMDVSLKPKDT